jgi:hypothetical protein
MPTIVDSTQCHVWTDALHARQLAREAHNKWDRGTYVRMCVTTAWIALETSSQEALQAPSIGYRFKENLDEAVAAAGLPALNWSSGVWQKVRQLQECRKNYVHRFASLSDMFPSAPLADDAILTVREGIKDIYRRLGQLAPKWVDIDDSRGWQSRPTVRPVVLTLGHFGVDLADPNAVRVYMVMNGEEKLTTVLPPGYDHAYAVTELLARVGVPIEGIRVYAADELVQDLVVSMRGSG